MSVRATAGLLPVARVPLVGREIEIGQVLDLLKRGDARLVTIVGAGGVGKSVLAEEAARRLAAAEPVSVHTVSLQGRIGPGAVDMLRATLDGESATAGPAPSLRPQGRRRLVVVDGAEARSDAALAVADAIDGDADVTVLATSITPMRVRGEHVVRLASLGLPRPGERDPVLASESPAVQLFCDRLTDVDASFTLTDQNAEAVAELCTQVGGLPLALELAAARAASLGVDAVLDLIRDSALTALTRGCADADVRHRSLRDTIAWSYDLLEPSQQSLVQHLAVFAGSFRWETLVEVISTDDDASSVARMADDLHVLVAAGMVTRVVPDRYALPAEVREFATEQFTEASDLGALRARHTTFFRRIAADVAARRYMFGATGRGRELVQDRRELLAAFDAVVASGDTRAAIEFAVDLEPLWVGVGATATAARRIEELLVANRGRDSALPAEIVIRALIVIAALRLWSREPEPAVQRVRLEEAATLASAAQRPDLVLHTAETAAQVLLAYGDPDAARSTCDDALRVAEDIGSACWRMRMLSWRAIAANTTGDATRALEDAIESRDIARTGGDDHDLLMTTIVLARVPGASEDPRSQIPAADDLLVMAHRLGDALAEGLVLVSAGIQSSVAGDLSGAARHVSEALDVARRADLWWLEELSLLVLVTIALGAEESDEGLHLHGALHNALPVLRKTLSVDVFLVYDALVAATEEALGPTAFARPVEGGRLWNWHEALVAAERLAARIGAREPTPDSLEPTSNRLSTREREVLELIAAGGSNKDVAAALQLRPRTVMHYTSSIYRKLGVRGRAEAVAVALQTGLLAPNGRPR
ncbi:MAG: LuxR C-terminal-related transcriptional regulator [Acidimicrobiia bacterium]